MVRQLPMVRIGGKIYYRDDRLEEFRAVDNPHDRITFKEILEVYLHIISEMNCIFNRSR